MGLPWIQVSVEMPDHPKVHALALELGIDRCQAVGHLLVLWTAFARLSPSGEIVHRTSTGRPPDVHGKSAPHTETIIARMAGWTGDADQFVQAMMACGLIDAIKNGYEIHDWDEHAGAFVEKFRRDAERKKKRRQEQKRPTDVQRTSHGRPPDVQREIERETEREIEKKHDLVARADALPPEPAALTLPCVGSGPAEYGVTEAQIAEWSQTFPAVEVKAELLKARAWLDANPTRRKTHKGVPRFLVSWLGRAQDRGGVRPAAVVPLKPERKPAWTPADGDPYADPEEAGHG